MLLLRNRDAKQLLCSSGVLSNSASQILRNESLWISFLICYKKPNTFLFLWHLPHLLSLLCKIQPQKELDCDPLPYTTELGRIWLRGWSVYYMWS